MPIYFNREKIDGVIVGTASGSTAGATLQNASDLRAGLIAYGRYGQITGTMQDLAATTYTPGTTNQTIAAGKYIAGIQTILGDANLVAANIKDGVTIFGVTGTHSGSSGITINNQNKTVIPTTSQQSITADSGYTGLGTVTVNAIQTETKSVTPSASAQTVTPSSGKYLTSVNVAGDSDLVAGNIKSGINIFGVTGTYAGADVTLQSKTITPTEIRQYTTPDSGYDGLSQVIVEPISSTYIGSDIVQRTATDVTASEANVTVPVGYYASKVTKSVATATQATPSVSIDNTGLITASATQTAGYVVAGTKSDTLQLTTKAATTITPSASAQTAVAKNVYTLGAISVAAVPSETATITSNGTHIPSSGKWFSSITVNVPTGSTINNQNKTVTPTKSQQSIMADSGYTGLGTVTVNAIPAAYITTSDADAVAANILKDKTAYVNGSKITGSMANNGATGGTITTQGGTYTIPAGYTSGGTVTANIAASSITNTALNVASFEETTGDYGVRASITIPAGYYNQTTLTKDLSTVLPAPDTAAAASQMLAGYQAYNNEGQLLTGTMTNNAAWSRTLDQTTTSVTVPAGYHNGTGTVSHTTVNIPDPTISVSSAGLITASGSWTRGFTTDNSYSNTKQLTTQAAKTVAPTESEQTAVASGVYTTGIVKVGAISSTYVGSGISQRDSDDLTVSGGTVTAPAGYYSSAASKSVASMTLPTSASSSATSGATNKATIGRSTSTQYINIPVGYNASTAYYTISATPNGTVTAPSSISGTTATVSTGTNTLTLTKTVSVTPNVTTAGYISSGTAGNSSVSLTASITTKGAATYTPGTSNQTISANQYLTGAQTIAGDADLIASNIKSGVNIFGVNGTFTSDADATANEIVAGATAYVDGDLITGTLVVNKYYTGATAPTASLGNNGDIYLQQ